MVVHLRVRRFVCRVRWCRRKIVAERLPDRVAPLARRTARLSARLLQTAFDLGGDPGARHLASEGVRVSARTLLRLIRSAPLPVAGPVRILSVDDWARRRGRTYGTILVNLETHTVIDLLPDREAGTLAAWLVQHPEIEVVSRDRAGAYAEGIRQGAPQALQVADRWHLMKNVGDAVERALTRRYAVLQEAAEAVLHDEQERLAALCPAPATDPPEDAFPAAPLERPVVGRALAQQRRQERFAAVQELRRQGLPIAEVARRLHLARKTVRQLAAAPTCPERVPRRHLLAPFEPYLRYRWAQGCRNARALFDELRAQGYRGSYPHLRHAVRGWRDQPARHGLAACVPTPPPRRCPACALSRRGRRAGSCLAPPTTAMTASARSCSICLPGALRSARSRT